MKTFGKIALILLLALFAVAVAITLGCSSADDEAKKAAGEEKGKEAKKAVGGEEAKKVEAKTIPLDSIYSTYGQEGLKHASAGSRTQPDGTIKYRESYGHTLEQLTNDFQSGASNAFLARGDDITAAVSATRVVFTQRREVDEPVSADRRSKAENNWLAVYFGVDSDSLPWLVKSVQLTGKQIQLRYTKRTKSEFIVQIERSYYVWVPLGKLEAGTYTLELFDEEQQQVTLLRRVKVAGK